MRRGTPPARVREQTGTAAPVVGAIATRCAALERLSRAGAVPDAVARVAAIEAIYGTVARALEAEAVAAEVGHQDP
jgi:hypothetical protein